MVGVRRGKADPMQGGCYFTSGDWSSGPGTRRALVHVIREADSRTVISERVADVSRMCLDRLRSEWKSVRAGRDSKSIPNTGVRNMIVCRTCSECTPDAVGARSARRACFGYAGALRLCECGTRVLEGAADALCGLGGAALLPCSACARLSWLEFAICNLGAPCGWLLW